MNARQRLILVTGAAIIALMLLFPPYRFFLGVDEPGRETNFGYAFILRPPVLGTSRGAEDWATFANVNWELLLTQWIGVAIITAILWLASKD